MMWCQARDVGVMRSEFWMLTDPNQTLFTHDYYLLTTWSEHEEGILVDQNRTTRSEVISHDLTIPWSKRELWLRNYWELLMRTQVSFSITRESYDDFIKAHGRSSCYLKWMAEVRNNRFAIPSPTELAAATGFHFLGRHRGIIHVSLPADSEGYGTYFTTRTSTKHPCPISLHDISCNSYYLPYIVFPSESNHHKMYFFSSALVPKSNIIIIHIIEWIDQHTPHSAPKSTLVIPITITCLLQFCKHINISNQFIIVRFIDIQ